MKYSVFLHNLDYFFRQTDGSLLFPNSSQGDLLKQAYNEMLPLLKDKARLQFVLDNAVILGLSLVGYYEIEGRFTRKELDDAMKAATTTTEDKQ